MIRAVRRAAIVAGTLAIAISAAAGPAEAGKSLESKWRAACWRDAVGFCTLHALANDRAGVRDCLVRNIDRISKACRAVIEEADQHGIHDVRVRDEPTGSAETAAEASR
jgi:hypothetical protein